VHSTSSDAQHKGNGVLYMYSTPSLLLEGASYLLVDRMGGMGDGMGWDG